MPVSFSWLISSPPPTSPLSPPPSLPPIIGSGADCPIEPYTTDALINIINRSYPADYLSSMRAVPNGGFELFETSAAVLQAVSVAVIEAYCCGLLMFAQGGLQATGTVEFFRDVDTGGALTILAGSLVATSKTGRRFITTEDAVFGPTDLGPVVVGVLAEAVGAQYNVQGQIVTAGGELLPGEIDSIAKYNGAAPALDPLMRVRQITATTGGRAACLDGLGDDLQVPREVNEGDDLYRLRILETPDTVSPLAIQRGLDKILSAIGEEGCFREIGTSRFPGFFHDAGSSADSPQVPANNYAHDMDFSLRPEDRFKLVMSYTQMRAFMLIGVPTLRTPDFGLLHDTTSGVPFPVANAHDTISLTALNAAHDGFSTFQAAIYQSIFAMVEAKRAGGVGFELYIEDISCP